MCAIKFAIDMPNFKSQLQRQPGENLRWKRQNITLRPLENLNNFETVRRTGPISVLKCAPSNLPSTCQISSPNSNGNQVKTYAENGHFTRKKFCCKSNTPYPGRPTVKRAGRVDTGAASKLFFKTCRAHTASVMALFPWTQTQETRHACTRWPGEGTFLILPYCVQQAPPCYRDH